MKRGELRQAVSFAALLVMLAAASHAGGKDQIVWKPVENAILQIDSRAPKVWNVFQPGKKLDPLLVQIGTRYLVIYVRNMEVYEIKPEQLARKADTFLWRETDKPAKPLALTDWNTKDVGSAFRIQLKLANDGRLMDIQIPKLPDLRGLY